MSRIRRSIVAIAITGACAVTASVGMQLIGLHKVEPLKALAVVYPVAFFAGFLARELLDYVR